MEENKFTKCNVEFTLNGSYFSLLKYVSQDSIRRIFACDDPSIKFLNLSGLKINVQIGDQEYPCYFTKEKTAEKQYYNLKFAELNENIQKKLETNIKKFGMPAPWPRKYPRIFTGVDLDGVTLPVLAIVGKHQGAAYIQVVNFSPDGLLIESSREELETVSIGERLRFDLMLSDGTNLKGITGEVVRIDEVESGIEQNLQLGIRFVYLNAQTKRKLRAVIIKYCESVKELHRGNA